MPKYLFITKGEIEIEAENEEKAWQRFWEDVEGQPQQTACDWIEERTEQKEV